MQNLTEEKPVKSGTLKPAKAGFIERLHRVMDTLNVPRVGRMKLLSGEIGMSAPGVKKLFDNDKAPRSRVVFDKLLHYLMELLSAELRGTIAIDQLEGYLLAGGRNPFKQEPGFAELVDDPLYVGEVILKIEQMAEAMGIDLRKNVKIDQHRKIYTKAVDFCCQSGSPDLDSEEVNTIFESLILFASKDMLHD